MKKGLAAIAIATAFIATGCDMYFGDDDNGDDCKAYPATGTSAGSGAPSYELRDPSTGMCTYFGNPNPYPCDGVCGPCNYGYDQGGTGGGALAPNPDWGQCYSACEGLDEQSCMTVSGCYAAYQGNAAADGMDTFWGCWQTAPSGPIHTGTCTGLDAQSCSQHDNCTAHYDTLNGGTKFVSCENEQAPNDCSNVDCAMGYHCEDHCYGGTPNTMQTCNALCVQDLTCASVDCGPGYTCSEVCDADANGNTTCHPTCTINNAACETLQTETECSSRADCIPVYDGQDCTCYPNGCSCQILTYERCESGYL